ncbi:MAG: 7TM diverse intracellular signaling domain-containing protein [Flavitalea sp.]
MLGRYSILILLLALASRCYCQPVTYINANTEKVNLSRHSNIFIDSTKELSFVSVSSAEYRHKFVFGGQNLSKLGYGIYPMWFHFRVQNLTTKKLVLVIDNAITVECYYTHNGQSFHKATSIYASFYSRDLLSNKISFLVDVPYGDSVDYYLRIETNSGMKFPLILYSLNAWIEKEHKALMMDGIYVGIMLIMILYNFFIYISTKDKSYLYYVLYVIFMTLTNLNVKSISFEFLWPYNPELNHYVNLTACLSGIFSILFTMHFLKIRQYAPNWRFVLIFIIGSYLITCIVVLLNYQLEGFILTESISLVAIIIMWICGFVVYRKGYKPAKYYLLAWTNFLICVAIFLLKDYNVLPYNDVTFNALTIGTVLEAMLLSLALADRINTYKNEKSIAQSEALMSLKENRRLILEQNIILEKKVDERTVQLKTMNSELLEAFQNLEQTQEQLIKYEKEKLKQNYSKELFELEAQALRAQMNPHFIFNCMNSIKALIQNDQKQKSIDYLTTFSKLLRTLLNNSDKRQVSLYDELETSKLYTQLEAMRLDGKLQYRFEVDENLDLKSVMVPALIIQPFIENAIWHGIVPKENGKVWIKVAGNSREITCEIDDDGIGIELSKQIKPSTPVIHQSKGINLSQARLNIERILSDKNAYVEIVDKYENKRATGTKVIIVFKLQ